MTAPQLKSWAFSTLIQYEHCAYRVKLSKIDKLPEPPREPNNPLERGSRIHDELEQFTKSKSELPYEAAAFEPFMLKARALYCAGMATAEDDWIFDSDWSVSDRSNIWLWMKLDLEVEDKTNEKCLVVDFKTGKSAYKAYEHSQQGQLYALGAVLRKDWVQEVEVEFWYIDEAYIKPQTYTREQALSFLHRFQVRADKMLEDRLFRPNPNRITCKWCPFSPRGTGACAVGV